MDQLAIRSPFVEKKTGYDKHILCNIYGNWSNIMAMTRWAVCTRWNIKLCLSCQFFFLITKWLNIKFLVKLNENYQDGIETLRIVDDDNDPHPHPISSE